jgi:hypothetical protein
LESRTPADFCGTEVVESNLLLFTKGIKKIDICLAGEGDSNTQLR